MRPLLHILALTFALSLAGPRLAVAADSSGNGSSGGQTTAPAGVKDMGKYLQGIMGVDSVETTAQPTRGQGAGATTRISGSVDLSCAMTEGQRRSARGAQIQFSSCQGAAGSVQMTVNVCVAPMFRAETCGAANFTKLVLQEDAYTTGPEGVSFGLGCNSSRVCTVSFSAELAIKGTGAELQKQADQQHAAAMNNDNSMVKGIGGVYGSQEYAKQQDTLKPVDIGQVLGDAATTGGSCTATGDCLRKVTSERKFTKTCDRSFLLTERAERTTLDSSQTVTCRQVRGGSWWGGVGQDDTILSDSCQEREYYDWGDGSYFTGNVKNLREGMTEIGKKLVSSCYWGGWRDGCDGDTYDVYYADLSKYDRTSVGYNPLPLSKANPTCDERPEAKTNLCQDPKNWFGRTKTDAQCTVLVEDADGQMQSLPQDYTQLEGCGICTDKTTLTTCYGEPTSEQPADSCNGVNLQGCDLPTVAPLTFSGDNVGLVTSQRETYSCTRTTQVCEEYAAQKEDGTPCSLSNPNVSANTFGIENVKKTRADPDGFAQAAADVAMAEEIGKGTMDAAGNDPLKLPELFAGKTLQCEYPTSSLLGAGNLLSKNCCRTDLERPKKGFLIQNGCDEREVELAASRRQNYSHFVGEFCSKKGLFGKCLVKKQSHCAYNGLFPRLIAEQGRKQLNELVASGSVANTATGKLTFDFYSVSDAGSWTAPVTVNGAKIAAYQWPKFCADPAEIARRQTSDPETPDCPGALNIWLAGCDAADCGELPKSPELGGMGWSITNVDPLSLLTTATSKFSVARGACDTSSAKCTYDIHAWPTGQGGKVVITKDMSFLIWDSSPQVANGGGGFGASTQTTIMGQQQNVSDVFYRPYSYVGAPQKVLPATVRIDFSTDGGTKNWSTVNVPTSINGEFSVPGTDLKLSGACDVTINACQFRLVGTAVVEPKGWGSDRSPDCSGFTAGQIAAMDFSKMDLSEWLDEVMARSGSNGDTIAKRLAQTASSQASNADPANGGQITPPSISPAPYAVATPAEGYGPFTATLAAGGYWPYSPQAGATNAEKVLSVMVKWGDCGAAEALPVITSINGQPAHGFRGPHVYKSPNDGSYASCGVAKDGTVEHKVELTVKTEKGNTYNTSLTVRNIWSNYQGNGGNVATPPPGP